MAERQQTLASVLIRALIPSWGILNPINLPRAPPPNIISLEIRTSTYEVWGDTCTRSVVLGYERSGSFGLVHWHAHSWHPDPQWSHHAEAVML